jgi:hypothetical protein
MQLPTAMKKGYIIVISKFKFDLKMNLTPGLYSHE